MKDKESLDYGQLMTGAVITGVQNTPNVQANIEVENGEYVKFPDNTVAKALGEKHEGGGISLIVPDMTEILSNTKDLKLTKSLVKLLKKEYELNNVSTNDTYSNVLDKYANKIGYTKVLQKEADLFNQVKKNTENALSEGSLQINNNYLAQKIYKTQQEKAPLQSEFIKVFNVLFKDQQDQKPAEEKEAVGVEQFPKEVEELSEEQIFKLGGRYEEFKTIAKKYNTPLTKAYEILDRQGKLPKFDNGGVYKLRSNRNQYQGINYTESQNTNTEQYGSIKSAEESLTQLYRNFPTILSNDYYKQFITLENGVVKVKEGVKLNDINQPFIGRLQRDMNTLMGESARYILEDKSGRFDSNAKQQAQLYADKELFNEQGIRDYDAKLGDFTSGRFSLGLDLVTPQDLQKLRDNNIYTARQLQDNPEVLESLSDVSKQRFNQFINEAPEGSDFTIERFSPPVVANAPEEKEIEQPIGTPQDKSQIELQQQVVRNRLYQMPDQRYLPPMALQAESMYETNLGRIEPVRLGIEDTIRRNQDNTQFLASQLQSLPPTVASGILASAIAQSQTSENQAINQIHQINAQNVAQADQFNIRQSDTEQLSNNQARLNYEQRALLGLSKTDQDIRNWYDANRRVNINNFREQQWMNTASNLFPQYSIGFSGTNVMFDPKVQQQYRDINRNYIMAMQLQQGQNNTTKKGK